MYVYSRSICTLSRTVFHAAQKRRRFILTVPYNFRCIRSKPRGCRRAQWSASRIARAQFAVPLHSRPTRAGHDRSVRAVFASPASALAASCRRAGLSDVIVLSVSPPSAKSAAAHRKDPIKRTRTGAPEGFFLKLLIKAQPLPFLQVPQKLPYRKPRSRKASYG